MGKSRLGIKSNALRRQRAFFVKHEFSRLDHNELTITEDFLDHQEQTIRSSQTPASSDGVAHHSPSISFELYQNYLEHLCHKRSSIREKALLELVRVFDGNILNEFVESTYITLLYRCLGSIKKGTTAEAHLACRLIVLLAVTVDNEDGVQELMKESVPQLCDAFKSGSTTFKILVLQCLAIVTFFGASNPDEVQNSMKFIWEACNSEADSTTTILSEALSAWSFLLSTVDAWMIHCENWKKSISFLSTLVEKDQCSVCVAAAEAMALILEIDRIYKFSEEASTTSVESLRCKLFEKVKKLYKECGGTSSIGTNNQQIFFQSILQYLETSVFDEVSMKISDDYEILKVSKWSQLKQLRYMEHALQNSFWKHMQENSRLHDIFMVTKANKEDPELEEKIFCLSSADPKERTQLRNRQRMLAQFKRSLFLYTR